MTKIEGVLGILWWCAACGAGGNGASDEPCVGASIEDSGCGNCGLRERRCLDGHWQAWSACFDEGECPPGGTETASCGFNVGVCHPGTRARTCSALCTWEAWGSCGGPDYVPPRAEVCDGAVDENCDGRVDEGCNCEAVAPGQGGSLVMTGPIVKLVVDQASCMLYALHAPDTGASEIVVIDTRAKAEVRRIPLTAPATDLDRSPSGGYLIASYDSVHALGLIDTATGNATSISTQTDPYAVEVADDGTAYYCAFSQFVTCHRVDHASRADMTLNTSPVYAPDIELSRDGSELYIGEFAESGSTIRKFDVLSTHGFLLDTGTSYGIPAPSRHVYLGPSEQHVYYAGYQLDAHSLATPLGQTVELVFAEDAAASFAVGSNHLFDAKLVRPVGTLPHVASAAALTAADRELWYYSADTGRLYYVAPGDLMSAAPP